MALGVNRFLSRGLEAGVLPSSMHFSPHRCIPAIVLGLVMLRAEGETTDPVGYMSFRLVAGKKGALPVPLANSYRAGGIVSAAGTDFVEFPGDLSPDLFGVSGSASLDVRSGPGAGISLRVTGVNGRRVTFDGPAPVPIAVGTKVLIRPDWSLGELMGSPPLDGILEGATEATADVLGLQDPATQTSREFFYKSGEGWREVGKEAEGDRSTTPIPYRSSLQFLRRGGTDVVIVLEGTVPMFDAPTHRVRVWPGRNLITSPFSPATTIEDLFVTSSLVSGRSAPRSDSFRMVYPDATRSDILYFHEQRGWTSIGGGSAEAGETPIGLAEAMDFQHVGEGAYLEFKTAFSLARSARALATAEQVIPVDPALSDFPARKIGWASQAGTSYQVQIQPLGSALWSDHGSPVVASDAVCQKECRPTGTGIFRIVVR